MVNTSDADIVGAFAAPDTTAVVTWKPQLSRSRRDAERCTLVFDSSKIPGEIIDLMVVNSATLKANPKLGKALVGAWYETLAVMLGKDAKATAALAHMAKASGTDLAGFKGQLATTKMYRDAGRGACASPPGPDLVKTMDLVRKFSFDHGLLGEGAKTVGRGRHRVPGGKTLGDAKANVKMRFDAELHEDGGGRQALSASRARAMRRLVNQHPGRGGALALGALPFLLLLVRLRDRLAARLAENPDDKLLPALGHDRRHVPQLRVRRRPAQRRSAAVAGHLGEPEAHRSSRWRISAAHRHSCSASRSA